MNANYEIITESGIQLSGLSNINKNLSTHYLIYRIDNIENNTFYIGQHKTNNPYDKYMGSGKILNCQMKKYSLSCYIKTILFDFDNQNDANKKELELVPEISCNHNNSNCLNIVEGGKTIRLSGKRNGMYGKNPYANLTKNELIQIMKKRSEKHLLKSKEELENEKLRRSKAGKELWNNAEYIQRVKAGLAKSKTPEYLAKLSKANSGKNNPMYGHSVTEFMSAQQIDTWKQNLKAARKRNSDRKWMYFNNGEKHKYVKPIYWQEYLNNGWKFGRKVKNKKSN